MNDLVPLLLLFALGRSKCPPAAPPWPTAIDPPPPLPPLPVQSPIPTPTDASPPSDAGKPKLPDFLNYAPPVKKRSPTWAESLASTPLGRKLQSLKLKNVVVLDLQKVLAKRGYKLQQDGLYGPETVTTWKTAAIKRKLNPTINKVSANVVQVHPSTWETLSGPVVP